MKIHKTREALQVEDSNIAGSDFVNVGAATCKFDDVNLQGSTFYNVNLSQAQYSDVNMSDVSIKDVNLTGMKINDVLVSELFRVYKNKDRASAVLFAKDVSHMQRFYQGVLVLDIEDVQGDYVILSTSTLRLIIHSIPEHVRDSVKLESPPRSRAECAIKLIFKVNSIAEARFMASTYGGEVSPSEREWIFQKYRVCDGHDPEGNVVQLWQRL